MNYILKGDICYSKDPQTLNSIMNGYVVCEDGISKGTFTKVPEKFKGLPIIDYSNHMIIPGLCDLHTHASQYSFRGLGMDMELLDWLDNYTFPEESKYSDIEYATCAYNVFVEDLKHCATTRACILATLHVDATIKLMEMLEGTGLRTFVGKVNMDINSPDYLIEESAESAYQNTRKWIENTKGRFKNTTPIITPRFIPTCSGELLQKLKKLQVEFNLPVQSHLSESKAEIAWVKKLFKDAPTYGDVYNDFGLFGNVDTPTIMAHCVWSQGPEEDLIKHNGVYIAHCPQSNANLASGIAPIRRFLKHGIRVGLGSDIAGGSDISIFHAMCDTILASKLYWRLVDENDKPLTVNEAFYLGTIGGGSFFGKVGSFESGYEFDAVVIDDKSLSSVIKLTPEERLTRIMYLSEFRTIHAKYVKGEEVKL